MGKDNFSVQLNKMGRDNYEDRDEYQQLLSSGTRNAGTIVNEEDKQQTSFAIMK